MKFSRESGSLCSNMQHPRPKLRVDALGIFFNVQEVVTQTPHFRRPVLI
jgi:hypothetical protein